MAAAADTVTFSMEVELAKLNAQLATIPTTTKKEAMAATAALKKSWDDATRAAKSTATQANAAITSVTKTATNSAGAVRAGYTNLLNQLSDVGSQLTTGTSPLTILIQQGPQVGGALDLIGVSLASMVGGLVAAAAAVGAGYAAWRIYNADTEEAARIAESLSAAHRELAPLLQATRAATIDLSEATGELSPLMADIHRNAARSMAAWASATDETRARVKALRQEQDGLASQVRDAGHAFYATIDPTGLLTEGFDRLWGSSAAAQREIDALNGVLNDSVVALEENRRVTEETIVVKNAARLAEERQREAMEAERRAAELLAAQLADVVKRYDEYKRELGQLADMQRAAESAQLDAFDTVRMAQVEALDRARQLRDEGVADAQSDARRRTAIEEQYAATVVAINEEAEFKIDKLRADAAAKDAARQEKALKDAERLRAAQVAAAADVTRTVGGYLGDISATSDGVYSRQVDTIGALNAQLAQGEEYLTETQKAELNNRIRAQEKGARRAFEIAKGLRIAQATANAYAAASQAFAEVPYPFNFAAGATALAAGMINVAQIASTEPAFHRGGMIDEQRITALSGEAVLSRQGVQALGGEQAVNRINSTGGAASGGAAVYAVSVYRHDRITERWQADGLRRGDPVSRAINAARTVPYGHRS